MLAACQPDLAYRPVALRAPYSELPAAPPGYAIEAGKPVALTPQQQEAVVAAVLSWMKDGSSTVFGEMRAARNSRGWITVCGEVDGRNSAGRLAGLSPFIGALAVSRPAAPASLPEFVVVEIGGTGRDRAVVEGLCRESGVAGPHRP